MLRSAIPILARLTAALAALAMVAVLSVHTAHRAGDGRLSMQLAALGLTAADLCADPEGKGAAPSPECPACLLAKALAQAPAQGVLPAVSALLPADPPPRRLRLAAGFLAQAPPARGPPAALV